MLEIIKNDDERYFEFIRKHSKSYVFNYFQLSSPEYNKLHFSYCETLPSKESGKKATSVKKVVSDNYFELVKWLKENVGDERKDYSKCQICNPKP